jgi:predicted RNA-binding Zn-ribbon protein involved in translation (DUF1610 family)
VPAFLHRLLAYGLTGTSFFGGFLLGCVLVIGLRDVFESWPIPVRGISAAVVVLGGAYGSANVVWWLFHHKIHARCPACGRATLRRVWCTASRQHRYWCSACSASSAEA